MEIQRWLLSGQQEKNTIRSPHMQNYLKAICALQPSFEVVNFSHIYREFNTNVDILSKEALAIQPGILKGKVVGEGDTFLFYNPL